MTDQDFAHPPHHSGPSGPVTSPVTYEPTADPASTHDIRYFWDIGARPDATVIAWMLPDGRVVTDRPPTNRKAKRQRCKSRRRERFAAVRAARLAVWQAEVKARMAEARDAMLAEGWTPCQVCGVLVLGAACSGGCAAPKLWGGPGGLVINQAEAQRIYDEALARAEVRP